MSKGTIRENFGRVDWLDIRKAVYNLSRFCYQISKSRPDIVYLITTADTAIYRDGFFMLVAWFCRCRILLHLHGTGASRPAQKWASRGFHRAIVRRITSLSNYIIVPTDIDLISLREVYLVKVHSEVVRNITNVPEHYRRSLERSKRESISTLLTAIGRLCELKGAWDLLEAFALVVAKEPTTQLTWIGLGAFPSDDEFARMLSASLGISDHVRFAGNLSDEEKFFELSQADIFVLPTHSEGFPLSLLEGMAMGLPVVTTPVGGIPEVVKDGVNGYLVPPKDIEMLAKQILTLVKEPDKRQQMGEENAKLYWEQLSSHKVVDRIHTLLRELT